MKPNKKLSSKKNLSTTTPVKTIEKGCTQSNLDLLLAWYRPPCPEYDQRAACRKVALRSKQKPVANQK